MKTNNVSPVLKSVHSGHAFSSSIGGTFLCGDKMESKIDKPSREELERYYLEEQLSIREIGGIYKVSHHTITSWMLKFNIPKRSRSEAVRLTMTEERRRQISKRRKEFLSIKENNPKWNGGEIKKGGYVLVYCIGHPHEDNKNYIKRCILIAEKALGRYLKRGENRKEMEMVHHVNRNRADDRNENLLICIVSYHAFLENRIWRKRKNNEKILS